MTNCRACGTKITPFFSLGKIPLVNSFLKKEDFTREEKFDLTVGFCQNCYLAQLMKTVPPEKLFKNYIYFSSTSETILKHNEKTAKYLTKRLHLDRASLVVEVASNDGAMLQYFKKEGVKILGIDPAQNIAAVANKKGIKTLPEFFNLELARKLSESGEHADLIYGANVLAHVPEITDFVRGVKVLLKDKGTAVFEFPYIQGLFENKFDTIYHEHVFYYSLIAVINLLKKVGLEIYDVEHIPMQGGSLRIFVSHTGVFPTGENVRSLVKKEIKQGLKKRATYKKIDINVTKLKSELIMLLRKLKKRDKTIVAYSAPAKGNILLNYFAINSNFLDFAVDKAKEKQGLYTPGTHLIVHPINKINKERPDYLLVLCWNIADEVMQMRDLDQFKKKGGKFIVPVPEIEIY